jgi:putative membrane protein
MTLRPADRLPIALLALTIVLLAVTGFRPYDRGTWVLEVFPILIAAPILIATRRRFPLTPLLYILIFLHATVLMVGGAYTYARVPFGFWMQDVLGIDRNPYDKIGHFAQGFVPALVAREVFIRNDVVRGRGMTAFLCVCVAMAVSAFYELVEWWAALALGQGADEFLGTQGYVWDTQSDMLYALIGSVTALVLLSWLHDRQLQRVSRRRASS